MWIFIAAACLVPAVLDGFQSYMQGRIGGYGPADWRVVLWQASEWIVLGALTPLTYWLGRRYPLRGPHLVRHALVHLGGALVLCVVWAASGVALRWILGTNRTDISIARDLASWMLTSLPWSVFMYFAVLGCVHAFTYFFEARERASQAARLQAQLAEARLGALRMQLNPHFLFNSLNAVTVLVRDGDTRAAAEMLERLGAVLREVLRADRTLEIPLREELRFLQQYLGIEQVRFSDRLRVRFDIGQGLEDAMVPGFILQPLVENALRHGIAKRSAAGLLEVGGRREDEDLVLWVRDDGPGPDPDAKPGGLGIPNTRERLATMYGERGRLTLEARESRTTVTVRFPLRREGERREGPDA